jgi:hypothetical protein
MNRLSAPRFLILLSCAAALVLMGFPSTAQAQQKDWIWLGGPTDLHSMYGKLGDLWAYSAPPPAPVFSPGTGTYAGAQTVTITDSLPGAVVYYTTDGSTPKTEVLKYSKPVLLGFGGRQTLQAISVIPGQTVTSPVASATYTIDPSLATPAAEPVFSPPPGTYSSAQTVTLTSDTPGAEIYYSIDGTPDASSTRYTGPI